MTAEEQQIRDLIAQQTANITAKNLDAVIANYAPEATLFDLVPPAALQGKNAIHALWQQCLPMMPEKFKFKTKDLQVHAAGELGYAHWTQVFSVPGEEHPADGMQMRVTMICQKIAGRWLSVHEHVSTPMKIDNAC